MTSDPADPFGIARLSAEAALKRLRAMTSEAASEEWLDAANRATFKLHWRRIMDRGLGDEPESAQAGILADLRATAGVYATARQPKKGTR
jgi:hypothetical protein